MLTKMLVERHHLLLILVWFTSYEKSCLTVYQKFHCMDPISSHMEIKQGQFKT
jgi:hypothetical protein